MNDSVILRTATRILIPVMLTYSFFLLLEGHQGVGGGFSAGLIASGAFALYAIAHGVPDARRSLPIRPPSLFATGLLLALVSGLIPLGLGRTFLEGSWFTLTLGGLTEMELGTPLLFDVGVYFVVIGVVAGMIFLIEEAYTALFPHP